MDDHTLAAPSFIADVAGTYTAQLQVFDGKTYSPIDSVTISVSAANVPPSANAGTDFTAKQGTLTNLSGSQSYDPDGQIVAWSWRQTGGSTVTLNNATSPTASFIAPKLKSLKNPLLTFELSVTDNDGTVAVDSVQVTIVR